MTIGAKSTQLTGQCVSCGNRQQMRRPDYCTQCGSPVILPSCTGPAQPQHQLPGIWKYAGRLPLAAESAWLSLGEGNTPVLPANAAAHWCGLDQLQLKLDHLNPSGSFKDRATAVGIAHARDQDATTVLCASSGNAAGSTAAYAAHAGMRAVVLMPESVPPGKLTMAQAHGAAVVRVRGDYSNSFVAGRELARRCGWVNLTTTYVNPVAVAGLKSTAYELAEQLCAVPDWIVVPVGAGPLVHGILSGYQDLLDADAVDRLPRIAAVQAAGCAPIVEAFTRGRTGVTAWSEVRTVVSGIADPLRGYPGDGTYTLRLVRQSGGAAVAVSDADISAAIRLLTHEQGLLLEPAAAASVAGARDLRRREVIRQDELVVCMLTGHGLKTLQATDTTESPAVDSIDEALSQLGRLGGDTTSAPRQPGD